MDYAVDPDIARAHTLEGRFYRDAEAFALCRERVFARAWHWLGVIGELIEPNRVAPHILLPGLLDEPVVLVSDERAHLRCLSNVCTHRGNILVHEAGAASQIRCGYHSRRFDLSGRMTFMPEFEGACDFPSAADHLPELAFTAWQGHGFASLDPLAPLQDFLGDLNARLPDLPLASFVEDTGARREFDVAAHWALYVENYLEGLHIPFVHPALNQAVEFSSYRHELFRYSNLQLAWAKPGESAFEGSERSAPDARVAAYYWWIFPNLMLNFYPWGLSVNQVEPLGLARTRVIFRSYVWKEELRARGAGSGLDTVEAEDERVVEAVQRGVRSRLYRRGRYSPAREQGVHHFHRLLCAALCK